MHAWRWFRAGLCACARMLRKFACVRHATFRRSPRKALSFFGALAHMGMAVTLPRRYLAHAECRCTVSVVIFFRSMRTQRSTPSSEHRGFRFVRPRVLVHVAVSSIPLTLRRRHVTAYPRNSLFAPKRILLSTIPRSASISLRDTHLPRHLSRRAHVATCASTQMEPRHMPDFLHCHTAAHICVHTGCHFTRSILILMCVVSQWQRELRGRLQLTIYLTSITFTYVKKKKTSSQLIHTSHFTHTPSHIPNLPKPPYINYSKRLHTSYQTAPPPLCQHNNRSHSHFPLPYFPHSTRLSHSSRRHPASHAIYLHPLSMSCVRPRVAASIHSRPYPLARFSNPCNPSSNAPFARRAPCTNFALRRRVRVVSLL